MPTNLIIKCLSNIYLSKNLRDQSGNNLIVNCNIQSVKNLLKEKVSMKCQGWTNINGSGDFNLKHNHPRSDLSGVFWIKTPKDSGSIVFIHQICLTDFKN